MTEEWDFDQTEELEENEQDVINYRISSYPADITLKGYEDKWNKRQLTIPDFQRNYVWDQVKASKLIESFLLGLPVPGVFLYKDRSTNKLAVIDGQQRILSAIRFFRNEFDEKIFRLKNVLPKWEGKTYLELDEPDRFQLDDTVLRATVVQQLDPADDSSIYHIFERLNTGGINLNPMEIRKCVYYGKVFDKLEQLNENHKWRAIIAKDKIDKRLRDVELILRILALYEDWESYSKPMKGFMNRFMASKKRLSSDHLDSELDILTEKFNSTCDIILDHLPNRPFHLRGRINYAAMDSIFVGIMRLERVPSDIDERYNTLVNDEDFIRLASISTSDESTLHARFSRAYSILSE
ncbi:DUF262 domain-containing protein [Halomonas sp. PAMB 3232]|uniref:DUF262 domain-containing protein n=1 Tax=Halomonas sp. PAMB 3232 TaxID=3075221 RepID=UPI00289828D3|nr:DUF262 domain-containing protein [Halomonas sp. PAMB 3232]WNL39612.1 DUF262 domain-containing protein [Halomonas sp. PAMB 3232]